MVYPGAGVANSTGSAWGTSYAVAGTGAGLTTGPTSGTTANDIAVFAGTTGQLQDSGIATSSGSPNIAIGKAGTSTGTLTLNSATATGGITLTPASAASAFTVTIPAATDTLVNLGGAQSLTNKSIVGSEINSGTVGAAYGGTGANNSAATGFQQWTAGAQSVAALTSAQVLAACSTCVTSAASLTLNQIVVGAGSQGSKVVAATFLPPSGDTSGATDLTNLNALATAQIPTTLSGIYYINGAIAVSAPWQLVGDPNTQIEQVSTTANHITVNYGGGAPNNESIGTLLRGFTLSYKSGVTPTAGYAISLSGTGASTNLSGVHVENIHMNSVNSGIYLGPYLVNDWITNDFVDTVTNSAGHGLLYDTASPGGDVLIDGLQLTGSAYADFAVNQCDTSTVFNLKVNNGAQVNFLGGGACGRMTFVRPSVEGTNTTNSFWAFNFPTTGTLPTAIRISAGQVGYGMGHAIGNYTGPSQVVYDLTDGFTLDGQSSTGGYFSNLPGSIVAAVTVPTTSVPANSCLSAVTGITMLGVISGTPLTMEPAQNVTGVVGFSPANAGIYFNAYATGTGTGAYVECNGSASALAPGSTTAWSVALQ
jgi:hypothetical protein